MVLGRVDQEELVAALDAARAGLEWLSCSLEGMLESDDCCNTLEDCGILEYAAEAHEAALKKYHSALAAYILATDTIPADCRAIPRKRPARELELCLPVAG
jgi:hypothetical protein